MLYYSEKKICVQKSIIRQIKNTQQVSRNQLELASKLLHGDFKLSVSHKNRVFIKSPENSRTDKLLLRFERIRQHSKVYSDPHGFTSNLNLNANFKEVDRLITLQISTWLQTYQAVQFLNNVRIQRYRSSNITTLDPLVPIKQ